MEKLAYVHQVLGIAEGKPTVAAVKAAYREISRHTHPDRFSSQSAEVQGQASAAFLRLGQAYQDALLYAETGTLPWPDRLPGGVYTGSGVHGGFNDEGDRQRTAERAHDQQRWYDTGGIGEHDAADNCFCDAVAAAARPAAASGCGGRGRRKRREAPDAQVR
jgi:hypothetical protein